MYLLALSKNKQKQKKMIDSITTVIF